MPQSEYKARQVRDKTREVVEYDHNEELPGKPLHILIPGGLIALVTLGLIGFIAFLTWFDGSLNESLGTTLIILLSPFYVGGVFLFSYGYELYNIPRALRLTAIIVFVTLSAVVILAVLVVLMGNSKGGNSRSSSSSSKKSSGGNWALGGLGAAASKRSSDAKGSISSGSGSSSSSNSNWGSSGGHIYTGGNIFMGGPTRVETREVTKEVVKEVPKEPMPITCPFCQTSYKPVEHKFICPSCGAATPRELIEESQLPKDEK
jgi:hypothetical protein